MRLTPIELDELDLPPLDGKIGGGSEDDAPVSDDLDAEVLDDVDDAFDDVTGEGDPIEEIGVSGAEGGWRLDSDDAKALDLGTFDVVLADEGELLADDEPDVRHAVEDELGAEDETTHADGGEEGPLADDEELREEDLPALDADEEGDVDETLLHEGTPTEGAAHEELRWDDRAWARVELPVHIDAAEASEDRDSASFARGIDPALEPRDTTWRRLEDDGRITAVAFVPGGSVVVAFETAEVPDRVRLVRIQADGEARIIAEIEGGAADDQSASCRVTGMRWDGARGGLVVTGTFGRQTFQPAL